MHSSSKPSGTAAWGWTWSAPGARSWWRRAPYLAVGVGTAVASPAAYQDALDELATGWPAPSPEVVRRSHLYRWLLLRRSSLAATTAAFSPDHFRIEPPGACPGQEAFYRLLAGDSQDGG